MMPSMSRFLGHSFLYVVLIKHIDYKTTRKQQKEFPPWLDINQGNSNISNIYNYSHEEIDLSPSVIPLSLPNMKMVL